jgi:hypothetical protein
MAENMSRITPAGRKSASVVSIVSMLRKIGQRRGESQDFSRWLKRRMPA